MKLESWLVVFAICGAICSGSVVLTGLIFHQLRQRFFMHLICLVAFCDMMVGIGVSLGLPNDGTPECTAQAGIMSVFLKGTWIWTTMLCYQTHNVVINGKVSMSYRSMQVFVWGTSILLGLLPLVKARFGKQGVYSSAEFCYLHSENKVWYDFWWLLTWVGIELFCVTTTVFLLARTVYFLGPWQQASFDRYKEVFKTLYLFPLILVITKLPTTILKMSVFIKGDKSAVTSSDILYTECYAMWTGMFIATLFFYKCTESRQRWEALVLLVGSKVFWCCWPNIPPRETFASDFSGAEEYESSLGSMFSSTSPQSAQQSRRTRFNSSLFSGRFSVKSSHHSASDDFDISLNATTILSPIRELSSTFD